MLTFILYFSIGVVAGLLSGLLGIGGGIVLVPALYFQFRHAAFAPELQMQMAISSSLAIIVFTSLNSTLNHQRHHAVSWTLVQVMLPGIIVGSLLGTLLLRGISTGSLKIGLGLFELGAAIQVWLEFERRTHQEPIVPAQHIIVSVLIGIVSTVLGIGGGTISVPYLAWCGTPLRVAVATGAALGIPIAFVGASALSTVPSTLASILPAHSSGLLYWPAIIVAAAASLISTPLGVVLAHRLPVVILRRCFAGVLILIGMKMLGG